MKDLMTGDSSTAYSSIGENLLVLPADELNAYDIMRGRTDSLSILLKVSSEKQNSITTFTKNCRQDSLKTFVKESSSSLALLHK